MKTNIELPKCPKHGKKSFLTEAAAVDFEEKATLQYNNLQQYAYACEDCNAWHLTTTPPGVNSMAKSHLGQLPLPSDVSGEELHRLKDSGLNAKDLAARFGLTEQTVYNRIAKHRMRAGVPSTVKRQAVTLEQVSLKRIELQRQLEESQRELQSMEQVEQRLREEQRMKYEVTADTITIRKKHEQITITMQELSTLVDGVMPGAVNV